MTLKIEDIYLEDSYSQIRGIDKLKIFDITNGQYPKMYNGACSTWDGVFYFTSYAFRTFFSLKYDVGELLRKVPIPIFLVESSMKHMSIDIPNCSYTIQVPEDYYSKFVNYEFDIDKWVDSNKKDTKDNQNNNNEKMSKIAIYDILGVYISDKNEAFPRRIYVWMDKIKDYVHTHTDDTKDIAKNAKALFELVLYHEISHAMMDVELYGMLPMPNFTYDNDYVYKFIEEAYANAIALSAIYNNLGDAQKSFIETFVKNQGDGYSCGWKCRHFIYEFAQWMIIKVIYDYKYALLLRKFWKDKDFKYVAVEKK